MAKDQQTGSEAVIIACLAVLITVVLQPPRHAIGRMYMMVAAYAALLGYIHASYGIGYSKVRDTCPGSWSQAACKEGLLYLAVTVGALFNASGYLLRIIGKDSNQIMRYRSCA